MDRANRFDLLTLPRTIWRGPVAFQNGLTQLADYLTTEGETSGYYVVFHTRPNVYGKLAHDELEFDVMQDEKKILVYLVQLELETE